MRLPAGTGAAPSRPPPAVYPLAAVEWVLASHGAIKTDLEEDPRKALVAGGGGTFAARVAAATGGSGRGRFAGAGSDDDD